MGTAVRVLFLIPVLRWGGCARYRRLVGGVMGALRLMGAMRAMGALRLMGEEKPPIYPIYPILPIFRILSRVLFLIPVHMGEASSWWGQQRGYYF